MTLETGNSAGGKRGELVMKTIATTVYTFDELSEEAKDKARDWWRASDIDLQYEFDYLLEDAETIGLKIAKLDDCSGNKGSFIDSAVDCAQAIIANHGEDCETYKTAKRFLLSIDSLNEEYPENADGERVSDIDGEDNYEEEKEELEKEFLHSLLEDYRIMYDKECDYHSSSEYVDENIIANGYTFTADGKRFG